jgi:AraC-like DNA-binding protein
MRKSSRSSTPKTTSKWPPKALIDSERDRSFLAYTRPVPRPLSHFTMGHFPPQSAGFLHKHPCIALHSCVEGPITLDLDEPFAIDSGVFFMLPRNTPHTWLNDGPHTAATMGLYIDTENPGQWPAQSGVAQCCRDLDKLVTQPHRFNVARDPQLQHAFWQAVDYLTSEQHRSVAAVVGNLWQLLGLIVERLQPDSAPSTAENGIAQKIRRMLLTRVNEQLTIERIADEVHVSPTIAKTAFREIFGCGIKTYFNQLKIWQAKRLLCDSNRTIDQISRELGFSSASHFSRAFLAQTGQSPSSFRESE